MTTITAPTGELRRAIVVPLDKIEWRDSGDPTRGNETTLRGHAAVFNSLSEDLGGFQELIAPSAFRAALRKNPDVRLLMNHDPNYVMGRTASGTLELREDGTGLHVFARVDRNISWVEDLRTSMQRGDIDQMSFAFTVAEDGDEWAATDDGRVIRTILPDGVAELYDVSVVTYPAYEASSVNMRGTLERAAQSGRIPGYTFTSVDLPSGGDGASSIEPKSAGGGSESRLTAGSDETQEKRLLALRARARAAVTTHPKETA